MHQPRGSSGLQNQRSTPCGPVLTPTSDDREPLTATTRNPLKRGLLRIAVIVVGPSQRGMRISRSTTFRLFVRGQIIERMAAIGSGVNAETVHLQNGREQRTFVFVIFDD